MKEIVKFPTLEQLPIVIGELCFSSKEWINRGALEDCQIAAANDYEAIQCWLNEYKNSPRTRQHYQRESDRLILWCIYKKIKTLSNLNRQDFEEYFDFIKNPEPKNFWCSEKQGGRGCVRFSKNWKPFSSSQIKLKSLQAAQAVIKSLTSYLYDAGYFKVNPLKLTRLKNHTHQLDISTQERILDQEEWDIIKQTISELPESNPHEKQEKFRIKLFFALLVYSGGRISECTIRWNQFRKHYAKGEEQWWLYVFGKGRKPRNIPVPNLMPEVFNYREFIGLSKEPSPDEDRSVFLSLITNQPITTGHLRKVFKEIIIKASKKLFNDPIKAERLKKCSPHWMRHLAGNAQASLNIDDKHIQANFGHASSKTTRDMYLHSLDQSRYQEMKKVKIW